MKQIKFNEAIVFTKARSNGYQKCIYCGRDIGKGIVALSMIKKCVAFYNVWLHVNCIDNFCKDIKEFRDKNIKNILMESV